MLDSTRIAEINNDPFIDQKNIDEDHARVKEARFQKMLKDSSFHNPARNAMNDAWADLLMNYEEIHDLVKIAMQSKDTAEERINRAKACIEIFEALEKTLWDWAD